MDRDAPANHTLESVADVVPPYSWDAVRKIAIVGLGMVAAATVLGLLAAAVDSVPSIVSTVRLLLVTVGSIAGGAAVSMRPDLWRVWALGAAMSFLAMFGTPGHWDSYQLVFEVLTGVAVVGAIIAGVDSRWRYIAATAMLVYHFGGIFMATVSPSPSPWFAEQIYNRFYSSYLQFIYLTNAYHFYSPQPGPASVDVFLLKTEAGDEALPDGTRRKKYDYRWLILPYRYEAGRDPLGLTYIRRLSLTHQTAQGGYELLLNPQSFERAEVHERRKELTMKLGGPYYPFHPIVPVFNQYQVPRSDVMNYILPSYAQHVILENTPNAATAAKTTVKIYRLEHETLSVAEFNTTPPTDPFHPATFRPFFLGEYGFRPDRSDPERKRARIELLDPQEKMLFWMIPVTPRAANAVAGFTSRKDYDDYLSAHALGVPLEDLEKEPHASRALNWSLFR